MTTFVPCAYRTSAFNQERSASRGFITTLARRLDTETLQQTHGLAAQLTAACLGRDVEEDLLRALAGNPRHELREHVAVRACERIEQLRPERWIALDRVERGAHRPAAHPLVAVMQAGVDQLPQRHLLSPERLCKLAAQRDRGM